MVENHEISEWFKLSSGIFELYGLLRNQLQELLYVGNAISAYSSSMPLREAHSWTVLKLCFLKLYIQKIYTAIIKNYYRNMFYIDLFAGSGLNQFKAYPDALVPGSPIIAWTFAYKGFDYMYLVEKKTEYSQLLEERMKLLALPEKFHVYRGGNANKEYITIIEEIEETPYSHFFAFIDPNAFEIKWETLERLLTSKVRGDFLILFQPRYIAMNAGSIISGRIKEFHFLNEFFGDNLWIEYIENERKRGKSLVNAALDYYVEKIRKVRKRRETIIEEIEVPLFRNISYFLIFVTNKTLRENPWMEKVVALKNLIDKGDRKLVEDAISEVLGRPQSILSFLE